ncbi:hypothetical protein COOONC_16985 [Cooperia oncophora]
MPIGYESPISIPVMIFCCHYEPQKMLDLMFRFLVNYTECSPMTAVGVSLDYMVRQNVDVVIGPPCPASAEMTAYLSTYYSKTMLGWGFLIDSIFSDATRFAYLTKVMPDSIQ